MKAGIESASLSEEAKSALKQIGDLRSNNSITVTDERRKINGILKGLTPEQRKEIKDVLHGN